MKIHRIALSNVRGIEYLDLDEIPDTGFILITGPNEQGKSTVMDAVYTALFHKHTANNRDVKALQPIGKDVGSTIIVDATIGPYTLSVTKTFNKQRSAHLAITRPRVDNYTGADAERVLAEILEQHLDRSLFTALFVRQGELSHSLKAAGIPTLSSVLSGTDVANSAAQPTDNTALLDRVDEEYRRYYTLGKGAATGELKAAMDDVEQLTAEMHTAEQRVQDLAIYVDRVAALADQKAAAEQRIPQIKDEIAQRELAFTAAEAAQNRVKQALQAAELASAAAENATRDWERRQDRITEVTQISAEVTDLTKQLADKHSERTHRDEQLAHLKERVELAKQQAATDAANLTAVNEQLHIIVGTQRLQELRRLIDAVKTLDAEIHKRRHSNAHIPAITTDMIDAAAQAEHAVLLATAKRDAHSAQLELSAAEAQSVMINGEQDTIGAQPRTYEIVDTLDINVSGVRIRALPGQSQIDAQQAVVDSKEALAEILDGTHCADVAELRSRYAEQQSAQEAVAALERERKATLQGRELDSLQSEEATLVEQLGEDLGDPEQLSVLREQQTELSERYDVSFAAVDAAKAELDAARDHTIDVDIRVVEAQLKAASQRGDVAGARLADERSHDADSEIERRVQVTNAALMEARQAVDYARETAEQHDYDAASRLLDGARNELADAERQIVDTQTHIAENRGRIEQSAGAEEHRDTLNARLSSARSVLAATQRRAAAVKLLRETLHRHRDVAQRRYAGPFAEKLGQLARLLFGAGVGFELNEELQVTRRTAGSEVMDVSWLSGGAQEQLAMLVRLAIAELVAENGDMEGVPVFVDDVLGNTDDERLKAMAAVLSEVSADKQVFMLSCQPQRYTRVDIKRKYEINLMKGMR